MSVNSDDTDLLLLIPPDFFSVKSDSEEDCSESQTERHLVSDLITQVNDLEGRICLIENQSLVMPGNLQQLRHFGSADTLHTSCRSSYNSRSLQTTPLKTNTLPSPCKSWRNSSSPSKYTRRITEHHNMLESHQYMNQKERDNKLLKEINDFFRQKNPLLKEDDKSETDSLHLSTAVVNLGKVNDLLKQLEETQIEIEAKLKLKGLTDNEDNSDESDKPVGLSKPLSGVLKSSSVLGNRSPRRALDFDSLSPKKVEIPTAADAVDVGSSNAQKVDGNNANPDPKPESQTELNNLLSLCNLWEIYKNVDDGKLYEDQNILKQKYQEEKCRRQHCEDLIQKLQLRLLEEQQKIAVAIKVDKEKDDAILKLTEGWNKLLSHWKEVENQKNAFARKLQSEREKFQNEVAVACQTVKRYETELSKALDLAHGYKEKCELSEQEKKSLTQNTAKELEILKAEVRNATERLQGEQAQTGKLEKLVAAKEESLTQAKGKVVEMQNQMRELKKALKDQQTETEILKHEKEKLSEKLKEERNKASSLEQSKKVLAQTNEDLKKKEKSLKENVKSMSEQMDKIKMDLKEFYQEQVEKIVQEKLKEFQEQLSTAEKTLQKELEERERAVTEMAVKQVQQIVEKHVQEVNLLEEKHKEEIELWKVNLLRTEEKVRELQKKLEHYSSHKTEIAQKLQSVMETQWQEALKIISASSPQHQKSPLNSGRSDSDKGLTRQNTFTMLSCGLGEGVLNKNGISLDTELVSELPHTEAPFSKDDQLTYREASKSDPKMTYRIDETPQKIDAGTTDPLKKYIQMLLERPPGVSLDDTADKSFDSSLFNSITDGATMLQWQHILSERSGHGNNDSVKQDLMIPLKGKGNKVPWK